MNASPPDAAPAPGGGLLFALAAYGMWGFFPIYWKFLGHVAPLEILAHRMVWSVLLLSLLLTALGRWQVMRGLLRRPAVLVQYMVAALFLAVNWFVYIWAVNHGFVVETALGYFINPLLNVVFGATLLGERARAVQWAAIGLAASGVLYLTWSYGSPPIIALTLAGTFAIYGLIKKRAPLPALEGLSVETALLALPALGYLFYVEFLGGGGAMGHSDGLTHGLLVLTGLATALPLLCFAAAVRRLTLTVLGVVQYVAPSIQLLLGVFLYNEPFSGAKMVGFALIWAGLILFSAEGLWRAHARRRLAARTV